MYNKPIDETITGCYNDMINQNNLSFINLNDWKATAMMQCQAVNT